MDYRYHYINIQRVGLSANPTGPVSTFSYGEMYKLSGSVSITGGVGYIQATGYTGSIFRGITLMNPSALVVSQTGIYNVQTVVDGSSSINTTTIDMAIFVNGSIVEKTSNSVYVRQASEDHPCVICSLLSLNSGDSVSVRLASTNTQVYTAHNFHTVLTHIA